MANWDFKSMQGIRIKGFNSHGDSFKDKPIYHLAKEICQNSTDTMVSHLMDDNKPVRIEFEEFWMKPSEIPGNETGDLTRVFEEELEFARENYTVDKTVPDIYEKTLNIIKGNSIRCLRISDFNTPGLEGSDKENYVFNPWNNLTGNVGVSDKDDEAAGSKGEGKFVTFLCSDLYTVFYSTISKKDNLKASIGVTRISGYKKKDGTITLGDGYYDNYGKAIQNVLNLDPEFERKEYGTDIYIIGFRSNSEWEETMTSSIIENFLVSIMKGNLEVNINNKYNLNRETIDKYINDEVIKNKLTEDSNETLAYYDILSSGEVISEKYSMFEKDDIELLLKKDAADYGDLNKVAAVRYTGMKIMNLNRFPRNNTLYHGVLLMKGKEVNKYFKKLENATHSKWSKDTETAPPDAPKRIDELRGFIRDCINKNFKTDFLDEINATGVEETLPDEEEFENSGDNKNNESIQNENIKNIQIKKNQFKPSENQSISEKEESGQDDIVLDDEGNIMFPGDDPNPPQPGPNPPEPNPLPKPLLPYSNVNRKLIPSKLRLIESNNKYNMLLKTKEDEEIIKIAFDIYGENGNESVKATNCICSVDGRTINVEYYDKNIILKNIEKNKQYSLQFDINSDGIYPLEVKIYGNNK